MSESTSKIQYQFNYNHNNYFQKLVSMISLQFLVSYIKH